MYKDICTEIAELLTKKRQDYGEAGRTLGRYGVKGIVVRLSDKFERLHGLTWEGHTANFESLEDTLMDMAGYSVLALEMLRKNRGKPNTTQEKSCDTCGGQEECETYVYRPVECKKYDFAYWQPKEDTQCK